MRIKKDFGGGNIQTAYEYGYAYDGGRRWKKDYSGNVWTWYPCGVACGAAQSPQRFAGAFLEEEGLVAHSGGSEDYLLGRSLFLQKGKGKPPTPNDCKKKKTGKDCGRCCLDYSVADGTKCKQNGGTPDIYDKLALRHYNTCMLGCKGKPR